MAPSTDEVPDSTDWLSTPVSSLHAVEAGLRCQICKDFYDAPVITTCSHTFCSACIRRSLSAVNAQKKCPLCWAPFDERQLRKNTIVEDLVRAFREARPQILELGRRSLEGQREGKGPDAKNGRKRKLEQFQEGAGGPSPRKTRAQSRRKAVVHSSVSPEPYESLEGEDNKDKDFQPDDGLAACPICQKRMPEAQVFTHLDIHQGSEQAKTRSKVSPLELATLPSRSQGTTPDMKPLPTLTYHLLSETQLRKKLAELGILNSGPKPTMIRRHTEWRNLVNANCDSSNPKSKRELLQDLKEWEKAQGNGNVGSGTFKQNKGTLVMEKDFDRDAWSQNHGTNFRDLIARARAKAKKSDSDEQTGSERASSRELQNGDTSVGPADPIPDAFPTPNGSQPRSSSVVDLDKQEVLNMLGPLSGNKTVVES